MLVFSQRGSFVISVAFESRTFVLIVSVLVIAYFFNYANTPMLYAANF